MGKAGVMPCDPEKFRCLLEERKRDLLDLSRRASDARKPVELDQQSVGRLSRQDALQQQAMAKAQENLRQRDLARIERALTRLEGGDYGLCQECEEEIAEQRLLIDPATELCLACRD